MNGVLDVRGGKYLTRIILIAIVLILPVGLFGCSNDKQATSNDKPVVRIGYFPNITHAQALSGQANGELQMELGGSVQVEWRGFAAGPAELEALLAGEIDIGYMGPVPAINGYVKSRGDIQIIAGGSSGGALLVSRKDLVITDLKDLSGKRVAVPQYGNTQDLILRNLLRESGLSETTKGGTVEIIQARNPDIKLLLENGDVDAAIVPEPWGSILIKEAKANIVLDSRQLLNDGKYSTTVIVVRKEYLDKHPEIVEAFLKNHVELTERINNNPVQEKQIINAKLSELNQKPLAKDVLDSSMQRLTVTYDPEVESINDFVNFSVRQGYLRSQPDTQNLFNLEILNRVLKNKNLPETYQPR